MDYFPLFARLHGVPCLVAGGGAVAERKIRLLERAGADITVCARELSPELAAMARDGALRVAGREYRPAMLDEAQLVFAATDDAELNARIAADAAERKRFCNVVDDRERSSVIVPGIVDRSPVVLAVSSGGASPVLTTRLRQQLERELPASLGTLARFLDRWRGPVKAALPDIDARRRFWQNLLDGSAADLLADGRIDEADALLKESLEAPDATGGIAWLTGTGPGDPGLLTLKAARALARADVVIHDRLVTREILELARRDAEIVSVGKTGGHPSIDQDAINALLVEHVGAGKRVCRLKGGDPAIFGRAGEEAEALSNAGLRWEIIPGITAASGCAAATGMPLTHRNVARSVTFVTARTAADETPDWKALTGPQQTVVLYMTGRSLASVCDALLAAGCDPARPALLICNGTTPAQTTVRATVEAFAHGAADGKVESPSLLVVGEVVRLAQFLTAGEPHAKMEVWLDAATANDDDTRHPR